MFSFQPHHSNNQNHDPAAVEQSIGALREAIHGLEDQGILVINTTSGNRYFVKKVEMGDFLMIYNKNTKQLFSIQGKWTGKFRLLDENYQENRKHDLQDYRIYIGKKLIDDIDNNFINESQPIKSWAPYDEKIHTDFSKVDGKSRKVPL